MSPSGPCTGCKDHKPLLSWMAPTSQTAMVLQLVTLVNTTHVAGILCNHNGDGDLLDFKRTGGMVLALPLYSANRVSWMGGGHGTDCLIVVPAGVHNW